MSWTASQIAVCLIGGLHAGFMIGELFPWECPWIMVLVLRKWPRQLDLTVNDRDFVSMVVHTGIYNGIVAVGLFVAAKTEAFHVQIALLTGGIVAGLFGAATLAKVTIVQAIFGAIALA